MKKELNTQKQRLTLPEIAVINLGLLMIAIGVYFFKAPNGFSTGGVSGFSIIMSRIISGIAPETVFSMGVINLITNTAMLILGFAFLGKSFGIRTVFCSLLYSAEIVLLEKLIPITAIYGTTTLTNQPFLELVFAILLTGIGSSLLFRQGTTSGGTDIVAMILKKYTSLDIGIALLCTDFVIAASSFFVYGITAGLYSMLGLFAKAFVIDSVIENMNICKCFMVITSHPEMIDAYITGTLHHSATQFPAKGIYSGEDKYIVITVCKRIEAVRLKRAIKSVDPSAFIIVTNSGEIIGRGFRSV